MVARLVPGIEAPSLRCETVSHGLFDLAVDAPEGGTFIAFPRGRHCKWTRNALKELDDRIGDFAIRGIRLIAASADGRAETERLKEEMQLIRLPLAHSLDVAAIAEAFGLYVTRASSEPDAPALNFEPAQIWVRQDNVIGAVAIQSGPNLWADVTNTLRGIENTMKKFPERGAGETAA